MSYFGKYAGKVEQNIDPETRGRVQISCHAVYGDGRLNWARPCVPYGGSGVGMLAVPPNGADIWVEFEGGDADHPIWTGCFWKLGDAPSEALTPFVKVIKTDTITILIDDTPGAGGVKVTYAMGGASLNVSVTPTGIAIDAGNLPVNIDGALVSINGGNLDILK